MHLARIPIVAGACLLLASCIFSPGKFVSTLDIKADRSFTFTYVGEVILTDPKEAMAKGMAEGMASSMGNRSGDSDADAEDSASPPAPAAPAAPAVEDSSTIAERKALAETLAKEVGYRSVEYIGNNKFRVDYAMSGRLDRSFLYPINIDAQSILPWIAIEVRKDRSARVTALAFGDSAMGTGGSGQPDQPTPERDGTFTLTTDAALVMQNNEDGTAPGPVTRIVWRVTPTSRTVPTAVVRFPQ
jgi:hypothetical protein